MQWVPPQDGGSPIRGYRVYKNGVKVSDLAWNVYSYTITSNLQAGNTYLISVSAYNDVGESVLSPSNSIMAAKVPNAPTNVHMIDQSATMIEISWETPDNGGTPLTTFTIYSDQGTDGATFTEIVSSTGLVTTYAITDGIIEDSVYQFKVQASNVQGRGD